MGRGQERAAPRVPRADPGGDGQMVELPWQELVEWKQHRTLTFLLSLVYTWATSWFPAILSLPGFLWLLVGLRGLLWAESSRWPPMFEYLWGGMDWGQLLRTGLVDLRSPRLETDGLCSSFWWTPQCFSLLGHHTPLIKGDHFKIFLLNNFPWLFIPSGKVHWSLSVPGTLLKTFVILFLLPRVLLSHFCHERAMLALCQPTEPVRWQTPGSGEWTLSHAMV